MIIDGFEQPNRTLRVIPFGDYNNDGEVTEDFFTANAICSDDPTNPDKHWPVIDFDLPIHVVHSSTPGHNHLYIDYPMDTKTFMGLLDALVAAGLVEQGFAEGSRRRGHADLRLPHIKKGQTA